MTQTGSTTWLSWLNERRSHGALPLDDLPENSFTIQALARHKMQGMQLAVRARMVALAVIVIMLPVINPNLSTLYYMAFAVLFAVIGWAQLKVATVQRSTLEVLLLAADLLLVTLIVITPNPFFPAEPPLEMQYRFNGHAYLYIYLALGTLAYSWRTIRFYAYAATLFWTLGAIAVWLASSEHPASAVFAGAMAPYWAWAEPLAPGNLRVDQRVQEIVIYAIVAFILSITVKRYSDLMLQSTAIERERTNLARYFSPNMVDNLSQNDEPLKQIKTQNVAVLFVDIVGFTTYSKDRDPDEVIQTLREFHRMMEKCIFDNGGTLDKFLGDGLMATFGTPEETAQDATNALSCANAMVGEVRAWNATRKARGEEEIRIGLGLHYGPCVLGDIGGDNRLEYAVIGDTVNIASRVEAKTRELGVDIAITQAIADKVREQSANAGQALSDFRKFESQKIRGLTETVTLLGSRAETAA